MKKTWSDSFWKHLHPASLTAEAIRFTHTFCLGGVTFLLFILLGLTGLLLLFHYLPLPEKAYLSITTLTFVIPFGGFIRSLHYWAGQVMVATLSLHMIRVFYYRAYQPPRRFNWLVGVGLLILTLVLDFTGYALRWDADTYAATLVGTQLLNQIPLLGPVLHILLVGGTQIGDSTLLRFYVLHCFLLPGFLLFLAFYHFWRVRKDGLAEKPL
ncbi:MAG: cytochrome b N-terminal domain-containing protein [Deltaproteobacteria bacterium]|nr:cytochrome b N-terminal domain-containing protein [Deltaproteobacteria bacterium]